MMKIAASTAKRMNWIAIERPAYQSTISGACFGKKCLLPNSSNSIRAVFAKSSEVTIHKTNGSLPTNSNLCCPPGMARHRIVCQIMRPRCIKRCSGISFQSMPRNRTLPHQRRPSLPGVCLVAKIKLSPLGSNNCQIRSKTVYHDVDQS